MKVVVIWYIVFLLNFGLINCILIGRFWLKLVGIEIFGKLVKLIGIVRILVRYIVIGLWFKEFKLKVVVGVVGFKIKL